MPPNPNHDDIGVAHRASLGLFAWVLQAIRIVGVDSHPPLRYNRGVLPDALSVVIAARGAEDEIVQTLDSLFPAPAGVALSVVLVTNGTPDKTADRAEKFRSRIEESGGELLHEHLSAQGKAPALRYGTRIAPSGPVMFLDTRVDLHPNSLDALLAAIGTGRYDVVSTQQLYQPKESRWVSAFARAYGASPYGRSTDLKGTCILIASGHREIVEKLPDTGADDRFFVASTSRDRRTIVDGAFVDYHFPQTLSALVTQQTRWVRGNLGFDDVYGDYDRGVHEQDRRPYFGPNPPDLEARLTYLGVMAFAHLKARLGKPDTASW